jgi:hypothetical protein
MIIDAVIYGIMPKDNTEKFASALPENRLSISSEALLPSAPAVWKLFVRAPIGTPGTGI